MSLDWLRLWHDMPTDPKWRTIARVSEQRIGDVIAVYLFALTNASQSVTRGVLHGWRHEDVATALDMEESAVERVFKAMQGRVLDGDKISGWEVRQPKREDSSTERMRNKRKKDRVTLCDAGVTQGDAPDKTRLDKDKDKKDPPMPPQGGASQGSSKRTRKRDEPSLTGRLDKIGRKIENGDYARNN